MQCVAFVSPLGGVGRTTLAAHSASLLAERGSCVLALDLSAQNTLGLHLGLAQPSQQGWYGAAAAGRWWAEAALENSTGVRLLPHGPLSSGDALPPPVPSTWLAQQMAELDMPDHSVVVVDTPTLPAPLAQQALLCADVVVFVLDASVRAVRAHALVQTWVEQLRSPQRWAVVVTGVDPRSGSKRQALGQLRTQWGEQLLPYVLHEDEYLPQALEHALCVHQVTPQAQSAHDLQGVARWIAAALQLPIPATLPVGGP